MVYPNRICSQLAHQRRIASALLRVDKRVILGQLVGDTLEEKFCFDMVSPSILWQQGQEGTLRVPFS